MQASRHSSREPACSRAFTGRSVSSVLITNEDIELCPAYKNLWYHRSQAGGVMLEGYAFISIIIMIYATLLSISPFYFVRACGVRSVLGHGALGICKSRHFASKTMETFSVRFIHILFHCCSVACERNAPCARCGQNYYLIYRWTFFFSFFVYTRFLWSILLDNLPPVPPV